MCDDTPRRRTAVLGLTAHARPFRWRPRFRRRRESRSRRPQGDHAGTGPADNCRTHTQAAAFELRIVGPDDKPVPDAKVTLLMSPRPNDLGSARDVSRQIADSFVLKSDADGRVAFERPAHLDYLNYQIRKPGYGYYWNWLNFQNKAKTDFAPKTAKLQRAWTIGGIFVDSDGKPIPNVRIILQLQMTGGQIIMSDRIWSNSKGIWKFESVARIDERCHRPNQRPEIRAGKPDAQSRRNSRLIRAMIRPQKSPSRPA